MLHSFAKATRKAVNNAFCGVALAFSAGGLIGTGAYHLIDDDWDNPDKTPAVVEQIETANATYAGLESLQKQFNILTKERYLDEMKNGGWGRLSDQMVQFVGERYKLETQMSMESDRWLMDLVKSEAIAEKDFEHLLSIMEGSDITKGELWSDFLNDNANKLHEFQKQYKDGGISDQEAQKILSQLSVKDETAKLSTVAGGLGMMGFLFGVLFPLLSSGRHEDFEEWARKREEKSKQKPKVARQQRGGNAL